MKVDYLIVGQGLAGSCLALQLIKKGKKVVVIDLPSENNCSVVAAGLFNPITGKFLKKTWMAEKLFPYLFGFYESAEKILGNKFLFKKPVYRPFESVEEQNEWMTQSENSALKDFIAEIFSSPQWSHQVYSPFGGLLINHSGYLDVNSFLVSVRQFLVSQQSFKDEKFEHSELKISKEIILYKNFVPEKIIFCEGTRIAHNPYFSWLPIRPMKGEVLSIELDESPEAIFNRGVYVVPASNGQHNVGATYQSLPFENDITEKGLLELESKLNVLLKIPFQVVGHRWGVRPTSPDRKPMIGSHPEHKNLFVFNGLGTKGVTLAPYISQQLTDCLIEGHEIMKDVNIQRFYPLYSGSI